MKREDRYLTFKRSDLANLPLEELRCLQRITLLAEANRLAAGKTPLRGVFIEADWPEHEAAWGMIEARVDGEHMHWASIDPRGEIDFAASLGKDFINGHINDALNHGDEESAHLVVRPLYVGGAA